MLTFKVCYECSRLIGCSLVYGDTEENYKCKDCNLANKYCDNYVFTPENVVLDYCDRCKRLMGGLNE